LCSAFNGNIVFFSFDEGVIKELLKQHVFYYESYIYSVSSLYQKRREAEHISLSSKFMLSELENKI